MNERDEKKIKKKPNVMYSPVTELQSEMLSMEAEFNKVYFFEKVK